MKKKNIIIVAVCILIIAIAVFFGYKVYNFRKFSFDAKDFNYIPKFISKFKVKDTITLKKNPVVDSEYITYKNFSVVDKFSNFEKEEVDENVPLFYESYFLKENGRNVAKFTIGAPSSTMASELLYVRAFSLSGSGNDIKRKDEVNVEKFYKDNNINSMMDLFHYALEHKDDKLNILTNSVEDRKMRTLLYGYMSMYFGLYDDIYLIDGDYEGIVGVGKSDNGMLGIDVVLYEGIDKSYSLSFMSQDYFDLDFVKSILETIVIE